MSTPRFLVVVLAAFALTSAASAQTTTYTWTGNAATVANNYGDASASASGNWTGGVPPVSDLNATIVSFGASAGLDSSGVMNLHFEDNFSLLGALFNAPLPYYQISAGENGSLRLGAGGLTLNGDLSSAVLVYANTQLGANQTWNINNGGLYLYSPISESNGSFGITKTGTGFLVLHSDSSTFSGGVDVQGGTLFVGGSSGSEGPAIFSGPVGTGTLTLRDNTLLRSSANSGIFLQNPISLGTNVTIGHDADDDNISLGGTITPLNTSTTLLLGAEGAIFFEGSFVDAVVNGTPTASSFRFKTPATSDSLGFAVLTGNNTYTGGTIADRAAVIFFTPGAVPSTGSITAVNRGYVATGYNGGMTDILSHISSPTSFSGSLGFDTDPENSEGPTIFHDDINLSAFAPDGTNPLAGFWGLGSQTYAVITGHITPPNGGNFVFGGGEGKLYVQSNLGSTTNNAATPPNATAAPIGVRVRSVYGEHPLTVWFQGENSFTGNLINNNSIVVLDSPYALPTGSSFTLSAQSYLGYTGNFTAGGEGTVTPAEFIARLQTSSYAADSILGFDSNSSDGRYVTGTIDLSSLTNIYLGTTTHAHLLGPIRAPSSGKLSLAGVNGGWLTVDAALTPTVSISDNPPVSGVTSLQIGQSNGNGTFQRGIVELTNEANTFAGGTNFQSGYLLVTGSSSGTGGAPTHGPLGTGALNFQSANYSATTVLVPGVSDVTLHNNITFATEAIAQFGIDSTRSDQSDSDRAADLQSFSANNLTLAGQLSGSPSNLLFTGYGTYNLTGDNNALTAGQLQIGRAGNSDYNGGITVASVDGNYGVSHTTPLLIATTDHALGSTNSNIILGQGADLQFTSSAPQIGSLMSDSNSENFYDRSYISLAAGSTLTIHQNNDGELAAYIGGTVSSRSASDALPATVNAALVKSGNATLTLSGQNTFSNGLTIQAGTVVAASNASVGGEGNITSGPVGTGTVTLAGGRLAVAEGYHFVNPIQFSGTGNVLSGNGTFHTAITIGTGTTLAPGNSPGTLNFANGLTWGPGGVFNVEIADMSLSAGVGYDQVIVSGGTFALTATAQNPFTLQLTSLADLEGSISQLGVTPTQPYSLAIFQSSSSLAGLWGTNGNSFDNIAINTSNFSSAQPGNFSLSLGNNDTTLMLNFTPTTVPEPSTYVMIGLGLLAVAYTVRRQRPARR